MWVGLAIIWLAVVKYPLSVFLDTVVSGPSRGRNRSAFKTWAREAAAGGPAAIAAATRQRVVYRTDPLKGIIDYVMSPPVTWARGRGDCDDFAYLSAALLTLAGHECWIANYLAWNVADSHTLCLFRDDKGYAALDQGCLSECFETLEAAARTAAPTPRLAATVIQPFGRGSDFLGRWIRRSLPAIDGRA